MYEINPKLGDEFALKPTSFQNLLQFVCKVEVFDNIIFHVSAPQILKKNTFS